MGYVLTDNKSRLLAHIIFNDLSTLYGSLIRECGTQGQTLIVYFSDGGTLRIGMRGGSEQALRSAIEQIDRRIGRNGTP